MNKRIFESMEFNLSQNDIDKISNIVNESLECTSDIYEVPRALYSFLNRAYEEFTIPSMLEPFLDLSTFLESEEVDKVSFKELWEVFIEALVKLESLDLKNYGFQDYKGVPIYYHPKTTSEVFKLTNDLIATLGKGFEKVLFNLDKIILCPLDYIQSSGDEDFFAYYINDILFIPCDCPKESMIFLKETLFHEFGHFVFDYTPFWIKEDWLSMFNEGNTIDLREVEGYDEDEYFADLFSCEFCQEHEVIDNTLLTSDIQDMFLDYLEAILESDGEN